MSLRIETYWVNVNYGGPHEDIVWSPDPSAPGTRAIAVSGRVHSTWDWQADGNPPAAYIYTDGTVRVGYGAFTLPGPPDTPIAQLYVQVTFEDADEPIAESPQVVEMDGVRVTVERMV